MTLERSTQEDNPVNVCGLTGTGLVSGMSNWNWNGLNWIHFRANTTGFFHIFVTRDGLDWNWTGNPNQSTSLLAGVTI